VLVTVVIGASKETAATAAAALNEILRQSGLGNGQDEGGEAGPKSKSSATRKRVTPTLNGSLKHVEAKRNNVRKSAAANPAQAEFPHNSNQKGCGIPGGELE
jgi:hypothetical protein